MVSAPSGLSTIMPQKSGFDRHPVSAGLVGIGDSIVPRAVSSLNRRRQATAGVCRSGRDDHRGHGRCRPPHRRKLAEEPVLLLTRSFASRVWFDAACNLARVRPRVLLESASPHTIVALAAAGYGAAIVPSTVLIRRSVHAMPIVRGTEPLGNWGMIAWDPQRSLAPYGEQFIRELAMYCRRAYPGRNVIRAAPALPPPKQSRKPPMELGATCSHRREAGGFAFARSRTLLSLLRYASLAWC